MGPTTADKLRMGDLFAWVEGGPTHRVRNADSWNGRTDIGLVRETSVQVRSDTPVHIIDRDNADDRHDPGCRRGTGCSCGSEVQCPAVYLSHDGYYDNVYRCTLAPGHPGIKHESTGGADRCGRTEVLKSWRDAARGVTYAPESDD